MLLSRKIILIIASIFIIIFLIIGIGLLAINEQRLAEIEEIIVEDNLNEQCITKTELLEVRGDSLAPLINHGETIKLLHGYYDCARVEREDIIAYRHAGNDVPIIKIVKGIQGDKFSLVKSPQSAGWNILINEAIVKNSEGQPYLIGQAGYNMLSLFVKDFKGIIPEGAYLILGNITAGSLDSTSFGLVHKSDFVGKVE